MAKAPANPKERDPLKEKSQKTSVILQTERVSLLEKETP